PAGQSSPVPGTDPLKYQTSRPLSLAADSRELLTVKVRYKEPMAETSRLLAHPVIDAGDSPEQAPADFRFAAALAAFGMLLRESPEKGTASFDLVRRLAADAVGPDEGGYRAEFLRLVETGRRLTRSPS